MPRKKESVNLTKHDTSTRAREPFWIKGFLQSIRLKANVTLACQEVKIARQTAYERRVNNPEFAAAWDDAMEEGADRLEAEAWRRAVEGSERPVFQCGKKVGSIREYSDTLMCLLLKGHKPAKFRERVSNEISGPNGSEPNVVIYIPDNNRRKGGTKSSAPNGAPTNPAQIWLPQKGSLERTNHTENV